MTDFQFLPHSLLEQAPAPKTTHELIEELSGWGTIESVWRGQSRTWALHSGAARVAFRARSTGPLHAGRSLESLVSAHEDALLAEARSRGHFGPETADLAALAILQHNGAATRFFDATTNLLVAAWFACSADKDDDGLLMLLPRGKEVGGDDLRVPIDMLRDTTDVRSFRPPISLLRAVAQHSIVLFGPTRESPACSMPFDPDPNCIVRVSPELKESLKSSFRSIFQMDEAALFPDLLGFCAQYSSRADWGTGVVGSAALEKLLRSG